MKFRIRIAYGLCSYGVALVLLLTPWFSAPEIPAEARIIPFISGALLLASAMVTDFEMGVTRLLKFTESLSLTIAGSLCVLLSLVVLSYGSMMWLIMMLASLECAMATLAFRMHYTNRHRLA